MANIKISNLPVATSPVASTDVVPVVQGGVTKQAALNTLGYLPAGTGAVTRTVQAKLRDTVSVKDFGAVGDGVADDTGAIQAAIDANPSKIIFFPPGYYKVAGTISVTSAAKLFGAGAGVTAVTQTANDVDTFLFKPTTAGSTAAFLNNPSISGVTVSHSSVAATSTLGAGIRFLQCNGYKLFDCTVNNAPEGITIQGGQLGSLKSFQIYASSGLTATADSALLYLRQAPYGAGLFQSCYTVEVDDFRLSASLLRETCIYIRNADGAQFSNAYVAFGQDSLLKVKAERDNSYVSVATFTNVYFDCVGAGRTPNGVNIPADGFANSFVYLLKIGSGCTIGNGDQVGVVCRKPETQMLAIQGATILNMGSWAADVEGSLLYTDLHITGTEIANCGDSLSGAIRAKDGRSLNISSNTFTATENICLSLSGTWLQGAVTGCTNSSNVPDISNAATFSYGLALAGNASRFSTAGATSWKAPTAIFATATLDFPSTAVGAASTLTMTVTGAALGDPVTVSVSGSTNIVNTGTAFFLFVGGVTAADTVSIRAYNLSGATSDPAALIFNVAVHKAQS